MHSSPTATIAITLACALSLLSTSCNKSRQVTIQTTWDLSQEAKTTYYCLLLEEAKHSHNTTIADLAVREMLTQDATANLYSEAVNCYWQIGRLGEAKKTLQAGLLHYPKNNELKLLLAQIHLAEKNLPETISTLEAYLTEEANDHQIRKDLAAICIKHELYAKALAVLAASPTNNQDSHILVLMGKALAGQNQFTKAITFLKRAIKSDPKFVEAWIVLASLYELRKDYVSAEHTYQSLMKLWKPNAELLLRLIEINLKLKKTTKALSLARLGPAEPNFIIAVATTFIERGLHDQAEYYLKPLLANHEQPEVYFFLAVIACERRKDRTAAAKLLENIPAESCFYKLALRLRIQLLLESRQLEKALELAHTARGKNLDQKEYWLLEAKIHEDRKDLEQAVFVLKDALNIWNNDTEIMLTLGILYENAEQHDTALAYIEQILALNPEHAEALNFVGYILADSDKDLDRAFTLITKAITLSPENSYIRDSLAWVLFKRGDPTKAWEEIRKAVSQADDNPTIWEHYGDIARAIGQTKKAAKAWHRALTLQPKNTDASRIRSKLNRL